MPKHVEKQVVPGKRLGRAPHDPRRPVLRIGRYFTGALPPHPQVADYSQVGEQWDMLGNDRFGDCGPAAVEHQRMQVHKYLGGDTLKPSLDDTLALYKTQNPDFDPNTDAGDNGVVLADMLTQVVKGGIGGEKALAYASVDVSSLDEIRATVALFGSVIIGIDLEVAQQAQTDASPPVWDYKQSSDWGGHAVTVVGYSSRATNDLTAVTWGQLVGVSDAFWTHQTQEAYAVIWPQHLGSKEFLAGVALQDLASDYKALTGRDFPAQVPPSPVPPPVPPAPGPVPPGTDPADVILANATRQWASARHVTSNARAAAAVRAWLQAKGL